LVNKVGKKGWSIRLVKKVGKKIVEQVVELVYHYHPEQQAA
jgi:hypothetical protein